jgi:hypothetical protein
MGATKLIDQEINEYLPHLNAKQKRVVLSIVKTFAAARQDWWNEIGEEQQKAIDKSLLEIKEGKLISHDPAKFHY